MSSMDDKWRNYMMQVSKFDAPRELKEQLFIQLDKREWSHALKGLNSTKTPSTLKAPVGSSSTYDRLSYLSSGWLSRAAAGLVLISLSIIYLEYNRSDNLSYEKITYTNWSEVFSSDEWLYMDEFCEIHDLSCEDMEVEDIQKEWDELIDAMHDIKKSLGSYGQDDFLIRELTHLEHEHAELINELIKRIWS